VSTTLGKLAAKFAAGVVATGGKFAAGVVDTVSNFAASVVTPMVHLDFRISPQIFETFETVLMRYSGDGGKLIHKKTRSKKSRDTVPLRRC
jgi:hypothetical protein